MHVHHDAEARDERDEAHVVAEIAERRGKAEKRGISPAAVIAAVVLDAHQVAARGADYRAGRLPLEHAFAQ